MLFGFNTEDSVKAKAAFIIYAIYKSRDVKRGPQGLDMWGQIERFAKSAAKRSTDIDSFINKFKKKMACSTINPYFLKFDNDISFATINSNNEIMTFDNKNTRNFALDIFQDDEHGKDIVDVLYEKTQIIILLVRDRLEREKITGGNADED